MNINRRRLVQAGVAVPLAATGMQSLRAQESAPDIAWERSVVDIREGYAAGDFTITEMAQACLDRIKQYDRQGAWIAAMIEINPDAMNIAREMELEYQNGNIRGPMHGIPVVIKDVFATADRMQTTAGAKAMVGTRASRDAFIVERIREAGMVILGKTNLTEWSGYRPVLYGWSGRGGLTTNPHVITQTTWGSSSGSAAAVAASYAPVAIGVETDGSIICPASACGVVGIKPTVGLVSRQGGIGNGYTMDSPGVMGRTVADAAALLNVVAGLDPEDEAYGEHAEFFPAGTDYASKVHAPGARDYVAAINEGGLEGARFGVIRSFWGGDPQADLHAEAALEALRNAGAEIIDGIYPSGLEGLWSMAAAGETMGVEFPAIFERYLRDYAPDGVVQSFYDIVAWYEAHPDESDWGWEYDAFSYALWPEPEWGEAHVNWINHLHSSARVNGIDQAVKEYDLDAFVAPTCSLAPRWDNIQATFWASSQLAASAGYPSVTLPIGYTEHMPAGLHFFGPAFSERKLIRYAAELERILDVRVPAEFLEYTNYDDWYLN
ncbi:MAG: amidase family protein [Thermomicrobiales bacterium]|nr:amidase family protein [Thermomicrobiales bacterium]